MNRSFILRYNVGMFKKILLVTMLLIGTGIGITNGYFQATRIEFEGNGSECYATLLSRYTVSGTWSTQLQYDLNAPEEVIAFFDAYKDPDPYFYLNYFQDVSEGLLYWPYYPPDDFKVLVYFPDTGLSMATDQAYHRYALTSTYKAIISDGEILLKPNYDYAKLIAITSFRIITGIAVSLLLSFLLGKPMHSELKYIICSTVLFQVLLNLVISFYSFRHGFSMVEYYLFVWLAYLPFSLLQGYLYARRAYSIESPYFVALFSNVAAYALGMFLVDNFPKLFTIA